MIRIKQISRDIKWKYLALSTFIAIIICIIGSLGIASIKEQAFVYWFNNIKTASVDVKDMQLVSQNFIDSIYWLPIYIFLCFIIQFTASFYLAKKTPDKELINCLALGIVCMILVYQFDPILSFLGIIVSMVVGYKVKENRLELLNNT
jgi:hypothetical protein